LRRLFALRACNVEAAIGEEGGDQENGHKRRMASEGTTPALSAPAVIIIAISLLGAVAYETMKRREAKLAEQAKRAERAERGELAVAVAAPA
jgi:hypothetical protein